MRIFTDSISEEISFYQEQNFRLNMEDLLRAIEGEKKIHSKQIAENEARIEKLLDSIMDVL